MKSKINNQYCDNTLIKADNICDPRYKPGANIITKVVGVTFEGRQAVVAALKMGEEIILRREPTNPFDTNAIRVERCSGEQIGYIDRYKAVTLASRFDAHGSPIVGTVLQLTGGHSYGMSLGVVIEFSVPDPNLKWKGGNEYA